MTRKELEQKITKALHKANHAKPLKLKLEKVNEVLEVIQTLLAGMSADTQQDAAARVQAENSSAHLEQYIELCHIHKLKFQLDALLYGVLRERKELVKQPEQMTQARFDSFVRRLNVVLDTDPEHPEALEQLEQLSGRYPQYAEDSHVRNVYIDLSPHQAAKLSVGFEYPAEAITQNEKLAAEYSKYQVDSDSNETENSETVRLQFSLEQLDAFADFHEEFHTSAQYKIFVNDKRIKESLFTEWFHCYKRYLKTDKPQYCYGASPFTLNVFGCHKLSQPDIAAQIDQCWFQHGELDRESGLFLIASEEIAQQIRRSLNACGFCPFLHEEKLHLGMGLLPQYINPECDRHWNYLYENAMRVGVVPSGSEIAIARHPLQGEKIDPSDLLEVGSSSYARRMLEYVNTQDKRVLSESRYKGITRCLNCGTHYKTHTMDCPRCKSDFVKEALENLDKVLRELSYIQPVKYPSPSASPTAPARQPDIPKALASPKAVSFDKLWDDPQIREILSSDPDEGSEKDSPKTLEQAKNDVNLPEAPPQGTESPIKTRQAPKLPYEVPEPPIRRAQSFGRFDLHGKLRSLVSKKYRERRAIEDAFSGPEDFSLSPPPERRMPSGERFTREETSSTPLISGENLPELDPLEAHALKNGLQEADEELLDAIKRLKPRQRSELSKRGVVRVIYHATMDKDQCPLCAYLDGMVMDPDDPGTDIFSPPLYQGCTCSREYVLKTEKPSNWPEVSFQFPPKELLSYLQRQT